METDRVPGHESAPHRGNLIFQVGLNGPLLLLDPPSHEADVSVTALSRLKGLGESTGCAELEDFHQAQLLFVLAQRLAELDVGPLAQREVAASAIRSSCHQSQTRFVQMLARNGWALRRPVENVIHDSVIRASAEERLQWLALARQEALAVLRAALAGMAIDSRLQGEVEAVLGSESTGLIFEDHKFSIASNDAYYLAEYVLPSREELNHARGSAGKGSRLTSAELPGIFGALNERPLPPDAIQGTAPRSHRLTPALRTHAAALLAAVEGRKLQALLTALDSIGALKKKGPEAASCALELAQEVRKLGESLELWTMLERTLQPH
jgi:hypothetical protein